MYYFYYSECCGCKKKTAIAYESLREAWDDLRMTDGEPDSDIEDYTTSRATLPEYVKNIAGDTYAWREYNVKTCHYVWHGGTKSQ